MSEEKYYLSFGAGVNSTAILALIKQGKLNYPNLKIVFADTGCEKPSTYCHVQEMVKHFQIDIVKSELGTLYDYCWNKKVVPLQMFRWCTDKFKIRPIQKWAKANDLEDAIKIIGFCSGEEKRVKYGANEEYPLIDLGIDREGCKKLIRDVGWIVPAKSGCYICPFQRKLEWVAMMKNDKELWNKATALEDNAKNDMTIKPSGVKLKDWLKKEDAQDRLFEFEDFQHCLCRMD